MTRKTPFDNAPADPVWYKDAVIYQTHVRAFSDSDGNGIGDFAGLTEKLDYLRELGVTAIWLLPFYPSPLKDDGYDIAEYEAVHPDYGTMEDFRAFLSAAHQRGLRVITELVVNHTSDQHPWFQRARRAPAGSPERDFYVWSHTPERYRDVRIIFKDFEPSNWTWDHVAQSYYWHRFYSHQPDLNFDNPEVRQAILDFLDFWMGMGVDGLRLDAVPYLYEREGTNGENLPETHDYLKAMRRHVDQHHQARMLLAEANQWPEDAVAYFGDGDECHMAFHFPVMPRMFMALRMEDRFPIIDILQQTPPIPDSAQWAMFLRNHDELTLEMVTDEERDYMYRMYAQEFRARINLGIRRRLAPLLRNDRRSIELMNGLLFSLPGTPVIYYGDEIGMGDNIYLGDRNGVRTPMQWSPDRNAGFSRANPQSLYLPVIIDPEYHYESLNVENQRSNPYSLLRWMQRIIALRKRYRAFGRGSLEFLHPDNRRVLAFLRTYEDEHILVVANLSGIAQYVELNLSRYKNYIPLELFGRLEFPPIGDLPYLLTLAPHTFYWFALEPQRVKEPLTIEPRKVPVLTIAGEWEEIFTPENASALERVLPTFFQRRSWFSGARKRIKSLGIQDALPIPVDGARAYLTLVDVEYTEGEPETYTLPLMTLPPTEAAAIESEFPDAVLATIRSRSSGEEVLLVAALADLPFQTALLDILREGRSIRSSRGELIGLPSPVLPQLLQSSGDTSAPPNLTPYRQRVPHANTSIQYGDRLLLKLFRRVGEGIHPEVELSRFFTQSGFSKAPRWAGAIEYRASKRPMVLATWHEYIPNEGTALSYTSDALRIYLERALGAEAQIAATNTTDLAIFDLMDQPFPEIATDLIGGYLESARLMGQTTAAMHVALASGMTPEFAPEPFSELYQRSIYQSMRNVTADVLHTIKRKINTLPDVLKSRAQMMLDRQDEIHERFRTVLRGKITARRLRLHGDFHLGQMLYTGRDFIPIDFEADSRRSLSERRIKRSPLRDVAGMLRSFHYAAYLSAARLDGSSDRPSALTSAGLPSRNDAIIYFWYNWVSVAYLQAYVEHAAPGEFLPHSHDELRWLSEAYLLEKAFQELGDELANDSPHAIIPMEGILDFLQYAPPPHEPAER